ncbi:MAG: beta-ketoacyl-[acyl-carrier-protein] synthase family protein [Planctomycetes bacterium]|nr:beta-ketoacyl-[acyl-carrier-protein] synthase family protein [Planctomycetota bacterium]
MSQREVVITGLGALTPLGIGIDPFWQQLLAKQSGIRRHESLAATGAPIHFYGDVPGFDPAQYVKPRKSLKVMARDSQLALAAASLARQSARLAPETIEPERLATVFAADTINPVPDDLRDGFGSSVIGGRFDTDYWLGTGLPATYPLNMLKLLPNMLTGHVSIAQDARGPCNTIYQADVSGLLALGEADSVIRRGMADAALGGGSSSRIQPLDWARHVVSFEMSRRNDDPAGACRPFDRDRDGQVLGEGAVAIVLEERRRAEARGATIIARLLAWASGTDGRARPGEGLRQAIIRALELAGLKPADLGHINAHGLSARRADAIEAQVLTATLPGVPVTAPKSYLGNMHAASGAAETIVSLLAIQHGIVPPTLNFRQGNSGCELNVLHEPLEVGCKPALVVNRTDQGQAVAMVFAPE